MKIYTSVYIPESTRGMQALNGEHLLKEECLSNFELTDTAELTAVITGMLSEYDSTSAASPNQDLHGDSYQYSTFVEGNEHFAGFGATGIYSSHSNQQCHYDVYQINNCENSYQNNVSTDTETENNFQLNSCSSVECSAENLNILKSHCRFHANGTSFNQHCHTVPVVDHIRQNFVEGQVTNTGSLCANDSGDSFNWDKLL